MPMLRIILAYTAGLLAAQTLPVLLPWWAGALVLVPALWPWRHRALLLALAVGFALTLWRAEWRLADRWPEARQGTEMQLQGQVASLPEWSRDAHADDAPARVWRFRFDPDRHADGVPSHLRVSWYRSAETVRGGDCWRFTLRVKAPRGSQNPGGFDYEGWLFRQGIGATATVQSAQRCEGARWQPVLALRQNLRDRIDVALPTGVGRALLLALVMGDSSGFSDADWNAFRLTGTSHLVAISGFNLALVAGMAFALLRWLWPLWPALALRMPAQKAAAIGAAIIAVVYALLAGFDPPITRALAMLLVVLAALLVNRAAHPFRVLALAWGLLLLADPFAVLSAGFWLSFGAVAAILWLTAGRLGREPAWRQGVRVQLWLSLLLAPLTLFYFQGTAWIAPFVNLLAVPWFALLTLLALVVALLLVAVPALGAALLVPLAAVLAATQAVLIQLAATWRDGWWSAAPPPATLLLLLLGAVLLSAPRGVPLRALGLLCLLPLWVPPQRAPVRGFDVAVLDVGQGLAAVVRTAHHSLLFDAGPAYEDSFDAGRAVVVPYLLDEGVRRLDVMMISHTDLDHRGGAPAVRELLHPREERGALTGTRCAAGQRWQWDGVDFAVLNGPADAQADRSPDNNASCVLRVAVNGHALLLPADIEKEAEARLLAAPQSLRAELLVAPHHGSKTSSTEAFVQAVNPDVVIFPAGYANHFRHPRPEVVARYQALGSALHMTGHEGGLRLHIDPETGAGPVQVWRQVWPHYWWAPVLPVPD